MASSGFDAPTRARGRAAAILEVFLTAGRLGLTSFGGPVAHIGYFRTEYVARRRWLSEEEFADLVGLCQLLPGPASSQLGISIGMLRAGLPGGVAAWLAFTAPSAAAMVAFASVVRDADLAGAGWVQGLKLAAVAVVAHAVVSMWRALVTDRRRALLALLCAAAVLTWAGALAQVAVIVAGAVLGRALLDVSAPVSPRPLSFGVGRRAGAVALALFLGLLAALPVARQATDEHALALTDSMYRAGALVFGGGHVVLPLLEGEVVGPGWVSEQDFVAGYGAAQAVPGPLFTFAGYLGAVERPEPSGVTGGTIALLAIFLPAFLLVMGTLPLWSRLRSRPAFLTALAGINAAVVGLLLAALYRPVFTTGVDSVPGFAIALVALAALALRAPPLAVVLGCVAAGSLVL